MKAARMEIARLEALEREGARLMSEAGEKVGPAKDKQTRLNSKIVARGLQVHPPIPDFDTLYKKARAARPDLSNAQISTAIAGMLTGAHHSVAGTNYANVAPPTLAAPASPVSLNKDQVLGDTQARDLQDWCRATTRLDLV